MSYVCMVTSIFDFASAVLLLWVAVHGHPCLGWVTVVGLVVAVEDLNCMGDIGQSCVFGNGGVCLDVVVGVVDMSVVSFQVHLLCTNDHHTIYHI